MEKNMNKTVNKNPLDSIIRSFIPSYKQNNPYIYKMTTNQMNIVTKTFRDEVNRKERIFKVHGRGFHLLREEVKVAKDVFELADRNSTALGCLSCLVKEPLTPKAKEKHDEMVAALKFITLANSPILLNNIKKEHYHERNYYYTVKHFFLYLALKVLKNMDDDLKRELEETFIDEPNGFVYNLVKNKLNINHILALNYAHYVKSLVFVFEIFSGKKYNELETKTMSLLAISIIIKQEKALYTNRKSSANAFSMLNDEGFIVFSNFEVSLLDQIRRQFDKMGYDYKDLMGFLTESENKIWLKDEPRMTTSAIIALVVNYLFMLVWAIIILYPIGLLLKLTINGEATQSLATTLFTPSASNFEFLFEETLFLEWTSNTFIVATSTALIVTFFCSLLAFAYSRFEFKGKKSSIGSVLVFQLIPAGLALVVFIVYGKYFTDELQLEGSHLLVLIIIYSGGAIAGNTFLLKGYMDTISADVFDAARIDGCSHMKVFRVIAIPLAKPMMAVIFLWSFVGPFFDFLLPTILAGGLQENYTMAAGLNTLITNPNSATYSPGAYAAGGMLVALPFAILFLSLNKQIVNGLTAGAVK